MCKIKAVLWDIDGTLLDVRKPESVAVRKCFEFFNLGYCTDEIIVHYIMINRQWWDRLERKEMSKHEILVGRFRQLLEDYGKDSSIAEEFNNKYQEILGDIVDPKPNALETLKKLQNKVLQGIVTNGTVKTQTGKLKTSGIEKYVSKIYISDEIGFEKPDIEFFDYVLKDLYPLKKEEIMIVGDSLTTDMRGGNNAGIICCWYNPGKKTTDMNLKIDYEISDLAQMEEIIK